jgi:hypothetical protein
MNSWSRSSWIALAVAAVSVTASAAEPPVCPAADGPASQLAAADCLVALARGHAAIADFEPAARAAEALAERFPRHPEAPELLVEAAWWRVGLGQRAHADADFERHAKLYAGEQPERAAEVFLSRGALLTDEQQFTHLTEYLRRFGKRLAPDLRLVAEARLGQIEWRRSCDKGLMGDVCLSIRRLPIRWLCEYPNHQSRLREMKRRLAGKPEPKRPRERMYCNRDRGAVFTVYARDERLARKAQQRFAAVLRAAGSVTAPANEPQRVADLADAQGLARLYVVDREFEAFLARDEPGDLGLADDDSPAAQRRRADGQRRLAAYIDDSRRLATGLEQQYAEVARPGSRWAVAAALRVGHIHESVGSRLLGAELPPALDGRYAEQRAYCREFAELAAPFLTAAQAAAERCREHARDGKAWSDYAELCADGLGDGYRRPLSPEIVGAPALAESRPETIGLQPFARWTDG